MMTMIRIINVLVNLNHFSTTHECFSKSPAVVYKRGDTTTLISFKNRIVEKWS